MGIYKNDYRKEEDEILWELHEIRQILHKANKNKSAKQINKEALIKYKSWSRTEHSGKKSVSA
jgi:hypothetical protein